MKLTLKSAAIAFALLVGIAYGSSIQGAFHFDDSHSIQSNMAIRSMANIPRFWTDPATSSFIAENRVYRPLVYTFYSVCWWIGGGETWPFHVMKMMMHWLVVLAMFLVWTRLWSTPGWFPVRGFRLKLPFVRQEFVLDPLWAAFFMCAIFAVHPATSEVVNYVSSTTSLQATMFLVWGYYFYLRYRDSEDGYRSKWLGASLGFYFLAVASKEIGVTLVGMIGLTEFFLNQGAPVERLRTAFGRAAPHLAFGLMLAFWIFAMMPASGAESRGPVSPHHYFFTQWRAWLWYMRLWFWPFDLNADEATMTFSLSPLDSRALQSLIGNLIVLSFAWLRRKELPAVFFGLAWFYVGLSPTSSFVPLAEAVNERRLYLPYFGFVGASFTFVLWFVDRAMAKKGRASRLGWIYSVIFIGLWIGTQERNRVWRTSENLWTDTVEKNPTSGRALNNLALVYMSRGEHARAVELFEKCEVYWKGYSLCPSNRGVSLRALGRHDEAEHALLKAHRLNASNTHVNFHLGAFYEEVRRNPDRAYSYFDRADEVTGRRYPAAKLRMAGIRSAQGRIHEARRWIEEAGRVDPTDQRVWFDLGGLELRAGRLNEAVSAYRRLLELNRDHLGGWYNYGVALMRAGQLGPARKAFERTVQIDPKSRQGWFNLAYVAEKMGDGSRALAAGNALVEAWPENREFLRRLNELKRRFGQGAP